MNHHSFLLTDYYDYGEDDVAQKLEKITPTVEVKTYSSLGKTCALF